MSLTKADLANIVESQMGPVNDNLQILQAGLVNLAESLEDQKINRLKLELIERIAAEEEPMRLELIKKIMDDDFDEEEEDAVDENLFGEEEEDESEDEEA